MSIPGSVPNLSLCVSLSDSLSLFLYLSLFTQSQEMCSIVICIYVFLVNSKY